MILKQDYKHLKINRTDIRQIQNDNMFNPMYQKYNMSQEAYLHSIKRKIEKRYEKIMRSKWMGVRVLLIVFILLLIGGFAFGQSGITSAEIQYMKSRIDQKVIGLEYGESYTVQDLEKMIAENEAFINELKKRNKVLRLLKKEKEKTEKLPWRK